jgi:anion-transporting  ArsA/GET3 family ATPase
MPVTDTRLIFVTGKGGVGKTTVAAALGQHAAQSGRRALIVETAADGRLEHLFANRRRAGARHHLGHNLDSIRLDARELVEEYFSELLRFSFLSKRLLGSTTFNALTAAAPGITEFLLLEKILGWAEPGGMARRQRYDTIIVDGPATGHAVKLLRTPRSLSTMVRSGPLGKSATRLLALLTDPARTSVLIVSLPEEMSVRETVETYATITGELGMHVARPVVNRVFPRRFTLADLDTIDRDPRLAHSPVTTAAHFAVRCRRQADRHVGYLRRRLGVSPVLLGQLFRPGIGSGDLRPFGRRLGRIVFSA